MLDQLAACREHLTDLDTREAAHFTALGVQITQLAETLTTIGRTLVGNTTALTRLDALDQQVAELARGLARPGEDDGTGYRPRRAPAWWKLPPDERQAPVAELRDWVEHVYRPGYGHLAALGPCWPDHELCLYGLDIASQLWCALYLQPERSTSQLAGQAEYQARILPALATQLATGMYLQPRCGHPAANSASRPLRLARPLLRPPCATRKLWSRHAAARAERRTG